MPDVARVHDDERVDELVLARPVVVARARRQRVDVDPVRDHDHVARVRALLGEPRPHRLADRDDAVRALEVEPDRVAQSSDDDGVVQPLQLDRDLGEDVLADHDERRAEPARDEQRNVRDHGRIGHAQDDVGPLGAERGDERLREIRRVVRRAENQSPPVERGRRDAHDRRRRRGALSPARSPERRPSRPSRRSPRPTPRRAARAAAPSPRPPASSTG